MITATALVSDQISNLRFGTRHVEIVKDFVNLNSVECLKNIPAIYNC